MNVSTIRELFLIRKGHNDHDPSISSQPFNLWIQSGDSHEWKAIGCRTGQSLIRSIFGAVIVMSSTAIRMAMDRIGWMLGIEGVSLRSVDFDEHFEGVAKEAGMAYYLFR
jgi:hypothetical protein